MIARSDGALYLEVIWPFRTSLLVRCRSDGVAGLLMQLSHGRRQRFRQALRRGSARWLNRAAGVARSAGRGKAKEVTLADAPVQGRPSASWSGPPFRVLR
jgi:hypothetical protein